MLKRWQDSWDQQMHNLLHELHSIVGNEDSLFLRSKSKGTSSLDHMSYRT